MFVNIQIIGVQFGLATDEILPVQVNREGVFRHWIFINVTNPDRWIEVVLNPTPEMGWDSFVFPSLLLFPQTN